MRSDSEAPSNSVTPLRKRALSMHYDPLAPAHKRRRQFALSVGIIDVHDIDMVPQTPPPSAIASPSIHPSPFSQPRSTRLKCAECFDSAHNTPLQTPDRFIKPKLVQCTSPSHQPLKATPRTKRMANLAASVLPAVNLQSSLRRAAQSLYSPPQYTHPLSAASHAGSNFYRSLDAPSLSTDYWRTVLDWGTGDVKAVALGNNLYVQTPAKVALVICSLFPTHHHINAVQLRPGNFTADTVAFGTSFGFVQVSTLQQHSLPTALWIAPPPIDLSGKISYKHPVAARSLDWNGPLLCTGYDGGHIAVYDTRINPSASNQRIHLWKGHRPSSFVAGLKWKDDGYTLASSGTDSLVLGWDMRSNKSNTPLWKINDFKGGVKSLAWCPWKSSTLAVGGTTRDTCIRIYSVRHTNPSSSAQKSIPSPSLIHTIPCSSSISSLHFSPHVPELLSTHCVPQRRKTKINAHLIPDDHNSIQVHAFPSWKRVKMIRPAHRSYVTGSALSPDGNDVVTAGNEECLMFWNIWGDSAKLKEKNEEGRRGVIR